MNRFIRCQAKTKSGNQCKTGAMLLTPFCGMHQGHEYPINEKGQQPSGKFTSKEKQ